MINRRRKLHQVKLSELDDYTIEQQLAADYGPGISKELIMFITLPSERITYTVYDNFRAVLYTANLREAVNHYNSLP